MMRNKIKNEKGASSTILLFRQRGSVMESTVHKRNRRFKHEAAHLPQGEGGLAVSERLPAGKRREAPLVKPRTPRAQHNDK